MADDTAPAEKQVNPTVQIKTSKNYQWTLVLKVVVIFVVTLVLQIPLMLVNGVVTERQYRQDEVNREIANSWASDQVIAAPVLAIPYTVGKETLTAYTFPDQLKIVGQLKPQERYRGIFKTTLYSAKLKFKGQFSSVNFTNLAVDKANLKLDKAKLLVGIKDVRGVSQASQILWNRQSLGFVPGVPQGKFMSTGIQVPVVASATAATPFEFNLDINGSREIHLLPTGFQTDVELTSSWPSPSFIGNYLPTDRVVTDKGFTAKWTVSPFAKSFSQQWLSTQEFNQDTALNNALGVSLFSTVDHYHQSDRAVKYGILFLTLTFVTYFLFEMVTKSSLNPFHYILVGTALCLFYLLLLSFSEVIGFMWAYVVSSLATVSLIGWFSKGVIKGPQAPKLAFIISGLLGGLYIYLYVLLQLEDLSLLFGSLGLFIALFAIMLVTRKIDWNNQ